MGYYVHTRTSDWTVPKENLAAALEAVKALDRNDELKSGGTYGPGGTPIRTHFAWMNNIDIQAQDSIVPIFRELGFEDADTDEEGTFHLGHYSDKTGDEDHFLRAIAPHSADGSYVVFQGEDNEIWRWRVRNGVFEEHYADITIAFGDDDITEGDTGAQ